MAFVFNLLAAPGCLKTLEKCKERLGDLTPLKRDCGRLCGANCCQPDAEEDTDENGMLLFPFEERLYQRPIEGFPFRLVEDDTLYKGGKRLICEGHCDREHRPLACRIFPLRVRIVPEDATGEKAHAQAEWDPRAGHLCPLADMGGLRAMDPAFIQAVEDAGNILIQNDCMLEALYNEQRLLDEMRNL